MPPAVNRSALALYSHRLVEDGERLRQFSLAHLEWWAREDVINAYEHCLAGHELGRWPDQDKADTSSSIS